MKIAILKFLVSFSLLSIFQSNIYCQVIKGRVLDRNSCNPIENAVVYFNATFQGTYTDHDGYFELEIKKSNSAPLTISNLGYYSEILKDYQKDGPIVVYLNPKTIELNEITISANTNLRSRKRNLQTFRDIFLGTTGNASKCIIINEDDIKLIRNKDTLYAYSTRPLQVLNEALGYKISYYLDNFSFIESSGKYLFSGNIIFIEDFLHTGNKDLLLKRRRDTYLGSKMHFFRALWENNLDIDGFTLEDSAGKELQYADLVIPDEFLPGENSPKYIKYKGALNISYSPVASTSRINFMSDSLAFFHDGNFDGKSVTWEGGMENKRVADLLPYDYLLKENLNGITINHTREKTYLHIDREIYNPGEDIWFKAYVVDLITNKPVPGINKLHVDLISPRLRIIQRRIVRISDGLGNGDFNLSDSLPSGKYVIRAYTNFARNFGEEFFYNKEFLIIGSGTESGFKDSIQFVQNKINIDFFPEGGSLIDNVVSFLAFKATDPLGKGVNVKGQVFSDKGEHINDFQSTNLGMGVFNLIPKDEESYYVLFSGPDGNEYKADLPVSFPEGVVLHSIMEENRLLLKILTNRNTLPKYSGKDLILTVSSRDLYSTTLALKIASTSNNYSIPLDSFPPGILKLTLNDMVGKPLAERLVFKNHAGDVSIRVTTDRETYNLREPVKATISLSGDTSTNASVSFSAFDSKMSADTSLFSSNIASWFLLESEVRGEVENASSYFDISNDSRLKKLDLLLMTQGWRDFAWKYDTAFQFKPELGFSLKGRILKNFQGKPYPGAKINIAIYDDKNINFLTVQTDDFGNFYIDNLDITGRARIIISCEDQKKEFDGYVNMDSIIYQSPDITSFSNKKVVLHDTKLSTIAEVFSEFRLFQKKYKLGDTLNIGEVIITAQRREKSIELDLRSVRAQYGKPDHEFILRPSHRNYVQISQVLAGNIPGVEVNTTTNRITVRGERPLILIDGIPTGGILWYELPPSVVDRVDILYWSSPFGSRGANGVINFITKRGEYSYESSNQVQSKSFYRNGFDQPRIFYSPKHHSGYMEGQTPDFRKTIYWEPNLVLNGMKTSVLNFYNSDEATEVFIKVEGITDNGIPVTGSHKYEIKADQINPK